MSDGMIPGLAYDLAEDIRERLPKWTRAGVIGLQLRRVRRHRAPAPPLPRVRARARPRPPRTSPSMTAAEVLTWPAVVDDLLAVVLILGAIWLFKRK